MLSCLSGAREIQTLKPLYSKHTAIGHFCLDFRDLRIRIDKNGQVQFPKFDPKYVENLEKFGKKFENFMKIFKSDIN